MVPESGEDSEDEWNYINVKHEDTVSQPAIVQRTASSVSSDVRANDNDDNNVDDVNDDNNDDDNAAARSPGIVEESHAVLQALVEPQEDFAEVSATIGVGGVLYCLCIANAISSTRKKN